MKTQLSLNGVDTDQLMQTVKDIKATPALAVFKFRANNKWLNGGHNRSLIKSFSGNGQENKEWQLDNDEPPVLLGTDHAPNPVEYILHGLAGCLTTSLVYHASARGISIESVESTLEGEIDLHGFLGLSEEKHSGYQEIRAVFMIRAEATEGQLGELIELAQKRSPVFNTLTNSVPVRVRLEPNRKATF